VEERKNQIGERRRKLEEEVIASQENLGQGWQQQTTVDLLGGLTDDEDDQTEERLVYRQQREEGFSWEQTDQKSSSLHRNLPQRGSIDVLVDDFLDQQSLDIEVKKNGKNDGVYLFGSRLMKICVKEGHLLVVLSQQNRIDISTFILKYEKVEKMRLRGLQAAMSVCTMFGSSSQTVN